MGLVNSEQLLSQPAPASIVIRRERGKPLVLSMIRLGPSLRSSLGGVSALIIANDLDSQPVPDEIVLAKLFGLSPAELQVAVRLAAGCSGEDCANELRLTPGTVRQLIKRVLSKSDTHRQSEFVALVNRIVKKLDAPTLVEDDLILAHRTA